MPVTITGSCPDCGRQLRLRHRRSDNNPFIGCSGYPACRYTGQYERELEDVYDELESLRRRWAPADTKASDLRRELRGLVFRYHPDRVGDTVAAHDIVVELNRLIERLGHG